MRNQGMVRFGHDLVNLQQQADNEVDFYHNKGMTQFASGGAGTNHVKSFDNAVGGTTVFGLVNLQQQADNEVDFYRNNGMTQFASGGAGTNHVKSFDNAAGGTTVFGLLI